MRTTGRRRRSIRNFRPNNDQKEDHQSCHVKRPPSFQPSRSGLVLLMLMSSAVAVGRRNLSLWAAAAASTYTPVCSFCCRSARQHVVASPRFSTTTALNAAPRTSATTTTSFPELPASQQHLRGGGSSSEPDNEYTPYEQWVRRLYLTNLFHPVKLGLTNMERLYKALGRPLDDVHVIHVAGTNGKGSVVYKLAQTLQLLDNSAQNVGMFVSPHIASFRERMQVNGHCISEAEVVQHLPRIYEICERDNIPATFFEITTALAMHFFAQRHCQVVVLETGLGGRLDSTNILTSPTLCIITSIGLEHTHILGDTVEKIAAEKGGIIKPQRPVLVGPHVPHSVLRQCAKDKQASAYHVSNDLVPPPPELNANAPVAVDYDEENARLAQAALQLMSKLAPDLCSQAHLQNCSELIERGTSARPPCRFETVDVPVPGPGSDNKDVVTVVLDVAHNPPALEYLVNKLQSTFDDDDASSRTRFRFVVGLSRDKDLAQCTKMLLQATNGDATLLHFCQAAHPRAAKLEDIVASAASSKGGDCDDDDDDSPLDGSHLNWEDRSITHQVQRALEAAAAAKEREVLVICGSVFIMAEAREALGFDEPRDSKYIAEVAGAGLRHGQEQFGPSDTARPSPPLSKSNRPSSP